MLEQQLIRKLLEEKKLNQVVENGITPQDFENQEVVTFILSHFKKYNRLPSTQTIKSAYPDFEFLEASEPFDYYLKEFLKRKQKKILSKGILKISESLEEDEVEEASQKFFQTGKDLQSITSLTESNWVKTSAERIEKYQQVIETKGRTGILSGIEPLDNILLGYQNEDLITFVGKRKIGKTQMICLNAYNAWGDKHIPLIVSVEISCEAIQKRLDAIHGHFSYDCLRRGAISMEDYQNALKGLSGELPFYITGKTELRGFGVSAIAEKINQYSPNIVFIDGVYLMRDERGSENRTGGLYNIVEDLKSLCKSTGLPIIVTTQMGKGKSDLESIQWADVFSQVSDVIISLEKEQERELFVRIIGIREGVTGEFRMNFDWDLQNYDPIPEYDNNVEY